MKFTTTVTVDAPSQSQAEQALAERLSHFEDYGFAYTIEFGGLDPVLPPELTEEEVAEDEKTRFPFNELARTGAKFITIEYHGSGDEGWIESITGWVDDPGDDLYMSVVPQIDVEEHASLLENIADNVLESKYPGWEINEGSQGKFILDLRNKTAALNHGVNYEQTRWEKHNL